MMKVAVVAVLLLGLAVSVYGACSGSPPTYNGLPCATTTRYWDDQEGACGCGTSAGPFSWNGQQHTAAASQLLFDNGGATWCGAGCGACYELTPTGDCPTGGNCATSTSPITIMISNLCPYNGNQQWCPNPGNANQYGYHQHFDLIDPNMAGWVDALGWNNPVVTYKQVACGNGGSPTCTEAAQCQCSTAPCSQSGSAAATATTKSATTAAATTKSATTAAATTKSATTASSSSATTAHASTTGSGAGCIATVSSSASNGQVAITVKNTGGSAITKAILSITGTPSVWNLVQVSGTNTYNLASYAYPLAAGVSFTGAGFTYTGTTVPTVSLSSVTC